MTDEPDITQVLRECAAERNHVGYVNVAGDLLANAADEIEWLRNERDRWMNVAVLFGEAFAIDESGQYVPSDGSDVFRAVVQYERVKRGEGEAFLGTERLRALITEWADADYEWNYIDADDPRFRVVCERSIDADRALRKAVGR